MAENRRVGRLISDIAQGAALGLAGIALVLLLIYGLAYGITALGTLFT